MAWLAGAWLAATSLWLGDARLLNPERSAWLAGSCAAAVCRSEAETPCRPPGDGHDGPADAASSAAAYAASAQGMADECGAGRERRGAAAGSSADSDRWAATTAVGLCVRTRRGAREQIWACGSRVMKDTELTKL